MTYHGYAGSVLYVDLTSGEIKKEPLDLEVAKKFIGGFGINNKMAYDLIKPGIDPFSEENVIILGTGPLCGTMAPGGCRTMGTTKFPINGAIASCSGSMSFGSKLKWAGYEHMVITGKAKKPVFLKIFRKLLFFRYYLCYGVTILRQ